MRQGGLRITLDRLYDGEVVRSIAANELHDTSATLIGPPTPQTRDARFLDGEIRPRPGYTTFSTTPTGATTGMFQAQFDDNTVEYLRTISGTTYYWSGAAWTSITAVTTGYPAFAMVRRSGSAAKQNQAMFSGTGDTDDVYIYVGGGTAASTVATSVFQGAYALVGHRGRGLVMNYYDVTQTARKYTRVAWSIVGDPTNYTGTGAGTSDLDDDPFPIQNALVIGGNVCVFKGNNIGGSVVVGSLIGNVFTPYRWDTINSGGVGLLMRRCLVAINPNLAIFFGHDDIYLYDGGRGLAGVGGKIVRDLLKRLNYNALDAGHAWYDPATQEVHFAIPTGGSSTPSEVWVYDVRGRRFYGPYQYTHIPTATCPFAATATLTIDTLPGPDIDSLPYASIDEMGATASARALLFGDNAGGVWKIDGTLTADASGIPHAAYYYTLPIQPKGRVIQRPDGSTITLNTDSLLTLHDFAVSGVNRGAWTPEVYVRNDLDEDWTLVSDDTVLGGTSHPGRALTKNYTVDPPVTASWFQFMIRAKTAPGTASSMSLSSVRMEFTYGGDERNH